MSTKIPEFCHTLVRDLKPLSDLKYRARMEGMLPGLGSYKFSWGILEYPINQDGSVPTLPRVEIILDTQNQYPFYSLNTRWPQYTGPNGVYHHGVFYAPRGFASEWLTKGSEPRYGYERTREKRVGEFGFLLVEKWTEDQLKRLSFLRTKYKGSKSVEREYRHMDYDESQGEAVVSAISGPEGKLLDALNEHFGGVIQQINTDELVARVLEEIRYKDLVANIPQILGDAENTRLEQRYLG